MKSKFSIREVLNIGWEKTKKHFWFFVGVELFMFFIFIIGWAMSQALAESRPIAAVVVNIFSMVLRIIFGIGFLRIAFEVIADRKPSFQMLFSEIQLFWKYLGASILGILISFGPLAIIFIMGKSLIALGASPIPIVLVSAVFGAIATIFGVIMGVRFQFALYFIVDEKHDPLSSLKESFEITRGEIIPLIFLGIILGFINFLGILGLAIGLLVTAPITAIALVATYKKLRA